MPLALHCSYAVWFVNDLVECHDNRFSRDIVNICNSVAMQGEVCIWSGRIAHRQVFTGQRSHEFTIS